MTTDRPIPPRPPNVNARRRGVERADVPAPPGYRRELPPIDAASAEAEPPAERVFPEPPAAAPAAKPAITLSTVVEHRGRLITISASDMTADQFCDLLDRRKFAAPALSAPAAAPLATPDDLPEGWKLCRKHDAPMRPRNKQNETWHSHNVGTGDAPVWCKGYRGADSPGYDL